MAGFQDFIEEHPFVVWGALGGGALGLFLLMRGGSDRDPSIALPPWVFQSGGTSGTGWPPGSGSGSGATIEPPIHEPLPAPAPSPVPFPYTPPPRGILPPWYLGGPVNRPPHEMPGIVGEKWASYQDSIYRNTGEMRVLK